MTESFETWRAVVDYEGLYEVSSLGRIRRSSDVQLLHGSVDRSRVYSKRYRRVALTKGRTKTTRYVHHLVCEAFHGRRPADLLALHDDGDSLNNQNTNLYWGSHSENGLDRVRHGHDKNAAKTHCVHGHEFTAENTYLKATGHRQCKRCTSDRGRLRYLARRDAA